MDDSLEDPITVFLGDDYPPTINDPYTEEILTSLLAHTITPALAAQRLSRPIYAAHTTSHHLGTHALDGTFLYLAALAATTPIPNHGPLLALLHSLRALPPTYTTPLRPLLHVLRTLRTPYLSPLRTPPSSADGIPWPSLPGLNNALRTIFWAPTQPSGLPPDASHASQLAEARRGARVSAFAAQCVEAGIEEGGELVEAEKLLWLGLHVLGVALERVEEDWKAQLVATAAVWVVLAPRALWDVCERQAVEDVGLERLRGWGENMRVWGGRELEAEEAEWVYRAVVQFERWGM